MSVAPGAAAADRAGDAAGSTPLLRVRDLRVSYHTGSGPIPAVRGVSFDLDAGETLGLAGESGCGKSTLAGAIMRLLPKGTEVTGEVLIGGEDVLRMKPGRLRAVRWTDMAIVFQGALHTLNPVQRVGRQIGEAIELHPSEAAGRRRVPERVGELLELVGLPARRAADYPHQLSGGQRQRVLIALALACDPRLLVADEPTTALDVMVQAQVLRLLRDLQTTFGLGVLFITHDLSTLAAVCRRLAIMYAGRVVEEGPSADVFAAPAHPYTRALAAAFPVIGDPAFRMNPSGLAGDPPDPRDLPSGCPFHPRCPVARPVCPRAAVELWPAGRDRRTACVEVLEGEPPLVDGHGAARPGEAASSRGAVARGGAAEAGEAGEPAP
jgi:peptide/nickel transport system ATP-binding protein